MSKTTIPRGGITADAIDATLITDDAISEEHLDATAITGHTALDATPADTDEFLISDAGTLKRIDYSYIKGGGGFELLTASRSTSAVSTVTIDDFTSSTYDHYRVIGTFVPATDNVDFFFSARTGGSSGATYAGSNAYSWDYGARYRNSGGGGSYDNGAHQDTKWKFGDNVDSDGDSHYMALDLTLYDWTTNIHSRCMWRGSMINNQDSRSGMHIGYGGGKLNSNIDATGILFQFSSGDVSEHSVSVFGIKKT